MRYIALLLLATTIHAQPCLIVKAASTSHRWLVSWAPWEYVAGDFPPKMKWKSNISDGDIRKVKENGGKVVVIPANYKMEDLDDARKQCGLEEVKK